MRARHVLPDPCLPPTRSADATGTIRCLFSDIDGGSGAVDFFPCLVSMFRCVDVQYLFSCHCTSRILLLVVRCVVMRCCHVLVWIVTARPIRSACTHTHTHHTLLVNPLTYMHTCTAFLKLCLLPWGWNTASCVGHGDVDVVIPVSFDTFADEFRISPTIADSRP